MAATQRRAEAIWIEKKSYWQVKVQRGGVRKAFTSSTPGRKGKHEAEAKADMWLETGRADLRFDLAWADYLAYVQSTTGPANTEKITSMGRKHLSPVIGRKRLSSIVTNDWQRCIDAAAKAGLSKRTCLNVKNTIRGFLTYAEDKGWTIEPVGQNKLKVPANAPVGVRQILQPASMRTLFTEDGTLYNNKPIFARDIYAWRFIVLTGLRRGELCGLKREDIEGRVLHVRRSITPSSQITPGKTVNAQRAIYLSRHALAVLSAQQDMLKREGIISPWLFPDQWGETMSPKRLYEHWRGYRELHGITSTIHELRHTFISAVKCDMPEPLLKDTVGHSAAMDTYGVYGHEMDGDLETAAGIVDVVFDRLIGDVK